jgi:hypothetical protein
MPDADNNSNAGTPPANVVKVRDDHQPLRFSAEGDHYKLQQGAEASWVDGKGEFGQKELRERIEPWLTSLFQSEHLSLLAGSGLTHAVHYLAADKGATGMGTMTFSVHQDKINAAAEASAAQAGRDKGNVEDQLRVTNELLRGLQILEDAKTSTLRAELQAGMVTFAESILKSEAGIATAQGDKLERAFNTLVTFLMSFASRTGTRDRLNIFTTNYDRLIEAGAELAGLHLLDRFLGNLMPIFRSSRLDLDMHYNPPGIRGEPRYLEGVARFIKLHGSVDWVQTSKDIRRIGLPFGADKVEPYLKAPGLGGATAYELMIYPNAAKDRETADYPYVELFRDLASAVCRPNSTLVTYGYSFGDEHVNRVIRDMLTIPSTHLVVISHGDPLGRVMQTYEQIGRPSQISLLLGPALADLTTLTENYLPKAAIDKATFRMSELLKQRFGTQQSAPKAKGTDAVEGCGEL